MALTEVLEKEEWSTWIIEKIKAYINKRISFNSRDVYSQLERTGLLHDYVPGKP